MRWTLPRYRYDQLMEFGWKWLLPVAVLNLIVTAALVSAGLSGLIVMIVAFYVFAAIAVVASLLVVGQRKPMHSVMLLIVSFGALSGLYVLLDAPFTAVTQIIIYAGAIMVLFLFVVMLLNAPHGETRRAGPLLSGRGDAVGAVLSVAAGRRSRLGAVACRRESGSPRRRRRSISSVARIGRALFTRTRSRSK